MTVTDPRSAHPPRAAQRHRAAQDTHPVAQGGAWSERLAASPRQARQAAQLHALFGPRGNTDASAGVVQGQFTDERGKLINDEPTAKGLVAWLARHRKLKAPAKKKLTELLVELANEDEHHGTLNDSYLMQLLREGVVHEQFGLKRDGRRLHTTLEGKPNFPPKRSATAEKLKELNDRPKKRKKRSDEVSDSEGETSSKGDFSYRDLRSILEKAGIDTLSTNDILEATQQAVQEFEQEKLFTQSGLVDVELVVQHLLQYHQFNTPQLKGRGRKDPKKRESSKQRSARLKREEQNEWRSFEFDKSGRLLETDALNRFEFTLPRDPQGPKDVRSGFTALQDVNRPVPGSTLEGAAYKAVYLCVKKVLFESWQLSRKDDDELEEKDLDRHQRQRFNKALARLMPSFDQSTVSSPQESVKYVQDTLGFKKFTDDEGYSEEESDESSGDDEPLPKKVSRSILNLSDPIEKNEDRIKTWTATTGSFSKLSLQKRLIDQNTLSGPSWRKARRKHDRRERKIARHVSKVSKTHLKHFRLVNSELRYLRGKQAMLAKRLEQLREEQSNAKSEKKKAQIGEKIQRVRVLRRELTRFYRQSSVTDLIQRSNRSTAWKRSQTTLRHLGATALEKYLLNGDKKK